MPIIDNDLLSMQEARILAEQARDVQALLRALPASLTDAAVAAVLDLVHSEAKALAEQTVLETDYGNVEDKYIKLRFLCERMPQVLNGKNYRGILRPAYGGEIGEVGIARGPLVVILPSTNPVVTAAHILTVALKSGNVSIFVPPKRARNTLSAFFEKVNASLNALGLPSNTVGFLHTVAAAGIRTLCEHPATGLIVNSCAPAAMPSVRASGKPFIYGSMGNNPVFVEKTANLPQAALDIISSRSFDYGLLPGAEQSIVVDIAVESAFAQAFAAAGAYFMNSDEAQALANVAFDNEGRYKSEFVGKNAVELARRAGFQIPDNKKVLVAKEPYVSQQSLYRKEKWAPILAWYPEADWEEACEKCIELLLDEDGGHSMVIYSRDEAVIEQFALRKPVGRLLINTPAAFGAIGMTTDLYPSFTLGSGNPKSGWSPDNLNPENLIYLRKLARPVRRIDAALAAYCGSVENICPTSEKQVEDTAAGGVEDPLLDSFNAFLEVLSHQTY